MIFLDTGFLFAVFAEDDLHHARVEEERAALRYLAKYEDKDYSFVDCISFVVMERLAIREALAVDEDFTHRVLGESGKDPFFPEPVRERAGFFEVHQIAGCL